MAQHHDTALRRQIGNRLRDLRVNAGITSQEKLAHSAGIHRTAIGRLERGESGVTIEVLAAILTPLDVTLGDFFQSFAAVMRPRTPKRR